jgi:hypothetical protein
VWAFCFLYIPPKAEVKFLKTQPFKEGMSFDIEIPRIELYPSDTQLLSEHFGLLHKGGAHTLSASFRPDRDLVDV